MSELDLELIPQTKATPPKATPLKATPPKAMPPKCSTMHRSEWKEGCVMSFVIYIKITHVSFSGEKNPFVSMQAACYLEYKSFSSQHVVFAIFETLKQTKEIRKHVVAFQPHSLPAIADDRQLTFHLVHPLNISYLFFFFVVTSSSTSLRALCR